MSEIELVTLRRAAMALLFISLLRWWATPGASPVLQGSPPVDSAAESLALLSERTRAAADDAERRSQPLGAGERIDPNVATAAELDRLPGVGPSTATAIVTARVAGTIFRRTDDLVEVRGIGSRTAEAMEPYLTFESARSLVRRAPSDARGVSHGPIDVNQASAEALAGLPGIGPALADRIVNTRRAERFRTLEDLTRVRGIGPATVARLDGLALAEPVVR